MRRLLLVTGALAVITSSSQVPVFAENWPNWRGPTRDGVSSETNLPVEWDTRKNVAWKLEMPDWTGSTAGFKGSSQHVLAGVRVAVR